MKSSLIVSHYRYQSELDDMLQRCVASIPADEKIIIVNDGIGLGKALNIGLSMATGDYLIVSNNDVVFKGDLGRMFDPEGITYPTGMEGGRDHPRSFYCMPRWVYEAVGGYDELFEFAFFEDDDMIKRWLDADIPLKQVDVWLEHQPGTTLDRHPKRDRVFKENKQRFIEKWGGLPHEVFEKKGKL